MEHISQEIDSDIGKLEVDRNSMLIWYPKIKDLNIPQPKTEIKVIGFIGMVNWIEEDIPKNYQEAFLEIGKRLGYPLFIRTDLASGKHSWSDTCFVKSEEKLLGNIRRLIEDNLIADLLGLHCVALVFRSYIEMDSQFTAFWNGLPISPERRYLIRDGQIVKHFPYWPAEAIRNANIPDWEKKLAEMNIEPETEIVALSAYVNQIAKVFPAGFWSIDFCKAKEGHWVLIDMACGEDSWHPDKKDINS